MWKSLALFVAVCFFVSLPAGASAQMGQEFGPMRVGLTLGYATAGHDDLNDTTDDFECFFNDVVDMVEQEGYVHHAGFDGDKVSGGVLFAGTVDYGLTESFLVGLEAALLGGEGGYNYALDYEYDYVDVVESGKTDYDVGGIILTARGTYLISPSEIPVSFRMGGGLGLVRGKLEVSRSGVWEADEWRYTEHWSDGLEASGWGLAVTVFTGAEYRATDMLYVTADVGYRFADVGKLTVSDVNDMYDVEEDETLLWDDSYFSTDDGDEVGLGFSGAYFGLGLAVAF